MSLQIQSRLGPYEIVHIEGWIYVIDSGSFSAALEWSINP